MARDPGSLWSPLPEALDGSHGRSVVKTQFIVHSTGTTASAEANFRYFSRGDVQVESHFIVGLTPADPTRQVMDTTARADANTTASRRGISVEVVGTASMPFTPHQVSELVRIGRWALAEHPILPRICPAHDASGCGWHVLFGAPGPWTTVLGKECPGPVRIAQLKAVIFPVIFSTSPSLDQQQEDTMKPEELAAVLHAIANAARIAQQADNGVAALINVANRPLEVEARLAAKIDALTAVLTSELSMPGRDVGELLALASRAAEEGAERALSRIRVTAAAEKGDV